MPWAVEAIGLTKYFNKTPAIKDINLRIAKAELFGLVGPNGAGKTTLLRILSTLLLPTSGTCFVNGHNLLNQKQAERIKSSINLVCDEERSFYWRLTGRQNLLFFASMYGISSKAANLIIENAASLLETGAHLDKMFKDCSSGIKQKFAIMRALLNDPAVIFMDEPTRNLDHKARRRINAFIKEELVAKQGKTVILSSHQLDEVSLICSHVAIMDKGLITMQGTLDELRSAFNSVDATLSEIFMAQTT